MSILLHDPSKNQKWHALLKRYLPDFSIELYPDITHPEQVEYAVVWDHPKGDLKRYSNLKAIFLQGAGVDHLINDDLPNVPIIRLSDPAMINDMALHSIHWLIHFHRHYNLYKEQQHKSIWKKKGYLDPQDFKVGVLGIGRIGLAIAEKITLLGYQVSGWSNSKKTSSLIQCYQSSEGLDLILKQSNLIILCLPLTQKTTNIINKDTLQLMPQGSFIINIGRGALINEHDLLSALETNQIAAAALDVFETEPLPIDSAFWHNKKVFITPHISGITYARSGAKIIAENIKKFHNKEAVSPVYKSLQGY